ncbi:MAG: hypothetical protein DRJ31_05260 [Candidatus Methanomethylicota archaeon]|uniref:GGDEF domain-containing protein n=1 Tax=Thermoproteota archaeon TaxID=2056631 RepID=A0A497EQ63_9CREN|nr:MAG: hypothetical protein DRJ31_05260 [Candidatus Verstraetearchaeota archaeon]
MDFPDVDEDELLNVLEDIRFKIKEEGLKTESYVTISISVVFVRNATSLRRGVYTRPSFQDPMYRLCRKNLTKAKKKGGNRVEILWL